MLLQTTGNIVDAAARLSAATLVPAAPAIDATASFPRANLDALSKEGLLGLIVPTEFGGLDASSKVVAGAVIEIAAGCASTAMILVMHCCGIIAIRDHMKGPARADILTKAASGQHLSTLAFSERGTGANFGATFTVSEQDGSGFKLNGEKCFVTSGGQADSYVLTARAPGAKEVTASTIYVVSKNNEGIAFHGSWAGVGLRGNCSVGMKLSDCTVDGAAVLGTEGEGLTLAMSTVLPLFLLGSASVYHGIARATFEACCNHVKSRTHSHNSDSLSNIPHVRRSVAQMKVKLDSSRAMLERAAEARDSGAVDAALLLMEAKFKATETANEIATEAMHVCGGIAYTGSLPIERHMRDALAGTVMAPTSDMLLDLIGNALLTTPVK